MTDEVKAPSEKALTYALRMAKGLGLELPANIENDATVCSAFIEANKEKPFPPSPKALEFAQSIAVKKSLTIDPAVLASAKKLSEWIDANKD